MLFYQPKKVFFLILFGLVFSSLASGYSFSNSYNCNAANGTDLNSLYGWYFKKDGTGSDWARVNQNICQIHTENGSAVINDDSNAFVVSLGNTVDTNFTWKGITTSDSGRIGITTLNTIAAGKNVSLRIANNSGDYNVEVNNAPVSPLATGTLTVDANYSFRLTRSSNVGFFTWSLFKNNVLQHSSTTDANLGIDAFHFFAKIENPGDVNFDNVSVSGVGDGNIFQVNVPKNVNTNANVTPFSITSSDLNLSRTGLTEDTNILIPSGVTSATIRIDGNADYFPSSYFVDFNTTSILQPYLTPISSGIEVIFLTFDSLTNAVLGQVRISVSTLINGALTHIQDSVTDSAGQTTINVIPSQDYNLSFYYQGNLVFRAIYTPIDSDTVKKAYLSLTTVVPSPGDETIVDINFGNSYLVKGAASPKTIVVDVTDSNVTRIDINFSVGNTIISSTTYNITDSNSFPLSIPTTVNTNSFDTNQFVIMTVKVTTTTGTRIVNNSFQIITSGQKDFVQYGQNAKTYFGFTMAGLIAVLIALVTCGIVTRVQSFSNPLAQILIAGTVIWFFSLLGWVSGNVFMLALFVGLLTSWGKAITEGN